MTHLYLDIFSGISGDMLLGALLDLGVPFEKLESELRKLGVSGYHLHAARGEKSGVAGVKLDVHLDHDPAPDHSHSHSHSHDHDHDHDHGHDHAHDHDHDHSHSHPHTHAHEHGRVPPPEPTISSSLSRRSEAEVGEGGDAGSHTPAPSPTDEPAHGRNYADIRDLILASNLADWVKSRAIAVFHRIAVAEGKIHGHPPDSVHFHEVGAVDSIVDIVGACIALDLLGRPRVLASRVVEGTGFVRCAHGRLPLPAPATLEIFAARGVPVTQCEEPNELVTPTGAALVAEFAESFGPLDGFATHRIGYGLGTRDNRTRPNVLRAALGEIVSAPLPSQHDWETDTVAVLETNLDDLSPEILGHVIERALAEGALDAFHTPVQMKKNRPGTLVTLLCPVGDADRFAAFLLTETSAFGVRQTIVRRRKLRRETVTVRTRFGEIQAKLGRLDGAVLHATPEYEDCRRAAIAASVPVRDVLAAATAAAHALRTPGI